VGDSDTHPLPKLNSRLKPFTEDVGRSNGVAHAELELNNSNGSGKITYPTSAVSSHSAGLSELLTVDEPGPIYLYLALT
jgi:hypothetical protein